MKRIYISFKKMWRWPKNSFSPARRRKIVARRYCFDLCTSNLETYTKTVYRCRSDLPINFSYKYIYVLYIFFCPRTVSRNRRVLCPLSGRKPLQNRFTCDTFNGRGGLSVVTAGSDVGRNVPESRTTFNQKKKIKNKNRRHGIWEWRRRKRIKNERSVRNTGEVI